MNVGGLLNMDMTEHRPPEPAPELPAESGWSGGVAWALRRLAARLDGHGGAIIEIETRLSAAERRLDELARLIAPLARSTIHPVETAPEGAPDDDPHDAA